MSLASFRTSSDGTQCWPEVWAQRSSGVLLLFLLFVPCDRAHFATTGIVLGEILAPESILFDRPENCDALSSPYCLVSVPWYGAETEVPPNITTRTPPIFLLMYPADFSSSAPSDMTICLRKLPPRELEISFTRDEVDFGAFWPLVPLFYLRSELAYTRHQTVLIDACLDERSFVEVGKKCASIPTLGRRQSR